MAHKQCSILSRNQPRRRPNPLVLVAPLLVGLGAIACEGNTAPYPNKPKRTPTTPHTIPAEPLIAGGSGTDFRDKPRFAPKPETIAETTRVRRAAWHAFPQEARPRRLSFFARNLAAILGDSVLALPLTIGNHPNPCRRNQLSDLEPRELSPLADQSLLVLSARKTLVIDSNCQTVVNLPKVSYIPGQRLLPEPRWSNAFTLYDSLSGSFDRYRWTQGSWGQSGFLLPAIALTDSNLAGGNCTLLRDASLACVKDAQVYVGWPGHPTRAIGQLASGEPPVRLLPAERADHVRVFRSNSIIEEYWLAPGAPKIREFRLPEVTFDIAVGNGYLAIVQVVEVATGSAEVRLAVTESDGILRWSKPIAQDPADLGERDWLKRYFDCRGIATHPTKPWIAVSECDGIRVFDARNGALLESIEFGAP